MSLNDFYSQIENYKYISFDVYDTLIFRTVSKPREIFGLVEALYRERYGKKIIGFSIKRIYAEATARKKYNREVTIDEIYLFLDVKAKDRDILKSLEKECEIKNCVPNKIMVDILKKCRTKEKSIIITSDMYLTKDTFDAIFQRFNIEYDHIFISGSYGKTKAEGSLFKEVLDKLNISANEIIHIGDNKKSDLQNPLKYGIASLERQTDDWSDLSYYFKADSDVLVSKMLSNYFNFMNVSEDLKEKASFRIGFTVLGLFLYSFSKWLHSEKKRNRLEKLLFVAREGYLLKQAYETMYPEEKGSTEYVYVNKNLLRLPSLKNGRERVNFFKSIPRRRELSWKDIVNFLYLNEKEANIVDIIRKYQINIHTKIKISDFEIGKYDNIFKELVDASKIEIDKQYNYLKKYLTQNGFLDYRVGLVNNSMKGSAQSLLSRFAYENNLKLDLYGLQFTANKDTVQKLEGSLSTFWGSSDYRIKSTLFAAHCLIFEHLLFAPSGTALRLDEEMNNVKVICANQGKEVDNNETISSIQEYALTFIKQHSRYDLYISDDVAKNCIIQLFSYPLFDDALLIGNLWDVDFNGSHKLCTISKENESYSLLLKRRDPTVIWMGGFLSLSNNTLIRKGWNLRIILIHYISNINDLYKDITLFIKDSVSKIKDKIELMVLRVKYIIVFRFV